jgi:hypothetical protein
MYAYRYNFCTLAKIWQFTSSNCPADARVVHSPLSLRRLSVWLNVGVIKEDSSTWFRGWLGIHHVVISQVTIVSRVTSGFATQLFSGAQAHVGLHVKLFDFNNGNVSTKFSKTLHIRCYQILFSSPWPVACWLTDGRISRQTWRSKYTYFCNYMAIVPEYYLIFVILRSERRHNHRYWTSYFLKYQRRYIKYDSFYLSENSYQY